MKRLLFVLLYIFFQCNVFAQSENKKFEEANAAYEKNQYQEAINFYEALIQENGTAEEIEYNLANAYYKKAQFGKAILHYERCLTLNPKNEDAQFNLQLANLKTKDKLQPIDELSFIKWWRNLVQSNTTNTWMKLTISCIWLALLAFALYRFVYKRQIQKISFYTCMLLFLFSLLFFVLTLNKNKAEQSLHFAIVLAPSAAIKSEPSEMSTNLFLIHEGLKIQILSIDENWSKIKMIDGNIGWISNTTFEKI